MEVNFTKDETLKLIEEYYTKLEDRHVHATATAKKASVGYYETEGCVTTISITEKIEIAGMQKDVKEIISEDQLHTILKALFELYNFDLTSISLNDGISSKWEGYGYNEHEVKTAYFKGITVNVKKQKNQSLEKKPKGN